MKNIKRLLALYVVFAVLVSGMVVPTAGAEVVAVTSFSDVTSTTENFSAINYLRKNGIVQGYSDGTFGVTQQINRAEFAKIVMLTAGDELNAANLNCYPDVTAADWFAPYICAGTEKGYFKGYEDGMFRPGQSINFVESSKIVANVMKIQQPAVADSTEWYAPYVKAVESEKAIPNSFNDLGHLITRAEMAEMVWRIDADASYHVTNTLENLTVGAKAEEVSNPLEKFESCRSMQEYFTEAAERNYTRDGLGGGGDVVTSAPEATNTDKDAEPPSEAPAPDSAEESAAGDDYSTTNVQVEGVDEADIVKTDGQYIYLVKGTTIRTVKAYPADTMSELGALKFSDKGFYPEELYIDGNKMVVIGYSYGNIMPFAEGETATADIMPAFYGGVSKMFVIDITDKSSMKVERELSFEGSKVSTRKVDDMVYLVLNRYDGGYYYPFAADVKVAAGAATYSAPIVNADKFLPMYYDSSAGKVAELASCEDVYFAPDYVDPNYLIVVGFSIDDAKSSIMKEVVLGSQGQVYASRDNLYVAEASYNWSWRGIGDSSDESTTVHKFALKDEGIQYRGKGKVPGTILNQFSMDEFETNFRIATTKGNNWEEGNMTKNNVYVLNPELDLIGKIEGIAPGENIYSTRFAGDRLYMVTFKKVDPFFVISLADPAKPEILGQLKIPGYSDYLHVYDENHVIGFGFDAVEASEAEEADWAQDFAWYQGIKLAMFDVTDVTDPKELHKEIIGDRGTNSPVSYNHKALLFSKEKGLMAFPVTVAKIPDAVKNDPKASASTYGDYVFQGAYIYNVSVEGGFDLKGTITHYTDNEVAEMSGYYWGGLKDIERVLYIKEFLYTVSKGIVKANRMTDLAEVKAVDLVPGDDEYWTDYPMPL